MINYCSGFANYILWNLSPHDSSVNVTGIYEPQCMSPDLSLNKLNIQNTMLFAGLNLKMQHIISLNLSMFIVASFQIIVTCNEVKQIQLIKYVILLIIISKVRYQCIYKEKKDYFSIVISCAHFLKIVFWFWFSCFIINVRLYVYIKIYYFINFFI